MGPAYYKFINIRHPFDRLLSAYYNIKRKNPGDKRGPQLFQMLYLQAQNNLTSYHNLTFAHFAQFLVDASHRHKPSVYFDRHWDSYARSCKVCSVTYDYILRTETFKNDSRPLLKLLDYPEDYLLTYKPQNQNPQASTAQNTSSPSSEDDDDYEEGDDSYYEKFLPEFLDLDRDLVTRLHSRYRLDFEAFGYQFDVDTSTAYCAIELRNGDVCC